VFVGYEASAVCWPGEVFRGALALGAVVVVEVVDVDLRGGVCWCRSGVAGCFLGELHARGEAEFGVDVGEVGLHGAS